MGMCTHHGTGKTVHSTPQTNPPSQVLTSQEEPLEVTENSIISSTEDSQFLDEEHKKRQQQHHEEIDQEGLLPLPPDGGWGWAVAGGVFMIALVVPMLSPSFGILFSRQLLEWQASSTSVAIIFSTFMVVWKLTGVVVGTLTKEFGFRRVAMTGTLLTATSLILSAFASSPELLFLFFSFGCGVGCGLSCVGYLILAQYFQRRRGLANTILLAGAGLGHFLSPLLIRLLQDKYGFRGATLNIGAIVLHAFVGATFFQPVKWHMKRPKKRKCPSTVEVASLLPRTTDHRDSSGGPEVASLTGTTNGKPDDCRWSAVVPEASSQPLGSTQVDRSLSRHSKRTPRLNKSSTVHSLTAATNTDVSHSTDSDRPSTPERTRVNCSCSLCYTVCRVFRSLLRDMRILRHPSSLIIALGSTLILNGEANFTVMAPFAIQAAGHSLQTAAWCVSVAGITNFLTRLCVSAMSDLSCFNMRLCYMAAMVTMSVSVLVFSFQEEVGWQASMMGVWGGSCGAFMGLNNLLMTEIVGLHNLTSMYGARNFLVALGFFTIGPFIGLVRDASGSYAVSMWVLSTMMFLSFVLWLFMPSAHAHDQGRRDTPPQDTTDF